MKSGRKTGLRFAMGLTVGLAFWGLIAATGLGAVLQASTQALLVLKLLGGAYLLWLAISSARSAVQSGAVRDETAITGYAFNRALFLNLSNPKAVLAWTAALALGIGEGSRVGDVAIAAVLCSALGGGVCSAYAVLFSTSGAMSVYARLRRWIEGAAAGLFALAGAGLLRSALIRQ